MSDQMSECCGDGYRGTSTGWGDQMQYKCRACGSYSAYTVRADYPEPARPTREDDMPSDKVRLTTVPRTCTTCGDQLMSTDDSTPDYVCFSCGTTGNGGLGFSVDLDDTPPRSACCDGPIDGNGDAHWCGKCGRQARPDGDGYNTARPEPEWTKTPKEARRFTAGPCERVGRYLDGALATVSEAIRLLTRRGCDE